MLHHPNPPRVARLPLALLIIPALCLLLSACGGSGSSGNARSLLRQTFSGKHTVNSGRLSFALSLQPTGSSTLTQPITLSLSGPFQSRGTGKLPASDFTVAISAQGHTGSLSILSTGTKGYVTMSGVSYQLPASSFQKLESSFSSIASSGGGASSRSGALSKLGINPLDWLDNPRVVGSGTVGGTQTTHIRASVNVPALLRDLSKFMQKAASLGVSGTSGLSRGLSAATQQRVAGEVQKASFDVWTGNSDKTIRRLQVGLRLPVSGQVSTALGGLSTAGLGLSLQYSQINQPQTITPPTRVQPYGIFSSKLTALLRAVESGIASGSLGSTSSGTGSTGSGTSTTSGGGASTPAGVTAAYSRCMQKAGQDVTKMQRCASKLNSGGG
ncbi:MAG TPA: hypothetical protein VFP55_03805 [Solirubrobacteraceae bacterium]|nr:hypothetical protein [Solirubrobacteraceae bacterium]